LIEHYGAENPFLICIENKIDAEDQPRQLERYYDYLKTKNDNTKILLIYLTKDGKKPSEISIENEIFKQLDEDGTLKLMSYRNHIREMLINSLPLIKPEKVKVAVNQYLEIIETF
jgi:hypothetical protein